MQEVKDSCLEENLSHLDNMMIGKNIYCGPEEVPSEAADYSALETIQIGPNKDDLQEHTMTVNMKNHWRVESSLLLHSPMTYFAPSLLQIASPLHNFLANCTPLFTIL